MSTAISTRATIDDLLDVEGKVELIGGRIVKLMGTGYLPNCVAAKIFRSLDDFAEATGEEVAFTDNIIFAVPELPSSRESFSPDAAYYVGPLPSNLMKPIAGAPTFAVEVRSEGDYGPVAERAMAAKRADYFAARTEVVWDVDPIDERIYVSRRDRPDVLTTYVRGQVAEAEPALPGWRPLVDDLFPTT